jgi:phosphatidylserine decarboxylase
MRLSLSVCVKIAMKITTAVHHAFSPEKVSVPSSVFEGSRCKTNTRRSPQEEKVESKSDGKVVIAQTVSQPASQPASGNEAKVRPARHQADKTPQHPPSTKETSKQAGMFQRANQTMVYAE